MTRLRRWMIFGACALLGTAGLTVQRAVPDPASSGSASEMSFVLVDSSSDLAARKAAVDKALAEAGALYEDASAQVQAAATAYVTANAELPGAQTDLAKANGSLVAARVNADRANAASVVAQAAVVTANQTVVNDNNTVITQQAAISAVVTSVYQGSALLRLNSLLASGSPGDVLNQFGLASELVDSQRKTLQTYLAAESTAEDALAVAHTAAQQASTAQTAAATALRQSRTAATAAQKAATAVNALIVARQAALVAAQKNKASVLAQYNELQKENAAVTTQLKAQAAADRAAAARAAKGSKSSSGSGTSKTTTTRQSGYFIMPIHGWKSSNFGWRFDPIYKRWQLHAGVDIADAGGTPIHAAGAGRVIRAGWDGGYGNYTCIDTGLYAGPGADHNEDIANCYAHQSRILVHVGQRVSTGQVIGLVGETGAATGYHLHFEVRVDGTPVQPLNWLPACFC